MDRIWKPSVVAIAKAQTEIENIPIAFAAALAVTIPEMDKGSVRTRAADIHAFILVIRFDFEAKIHEKKIRYYKSNG